MRRFRIYAGPTIVEEVALRLSKEHVDVKCVGTAHVYVDTDKGSEGLLRVLGPTWKASDILELV